MKKIRILSILTLLLTVTMLFTSCGKGTIGATSSYDKVLNPDYDVSGESFTAGAQVEDLDGYLPLRYLSSNSKGEFSMVDMEIFYSVDAETGATSYKVYSFLNNKVVLTFDEEDVTYDFDTQNYNEYGLLFVSETVFNGTEEDDPTDESLYEVTYYAYDATGAQIATTDEEDGFDAPFYLGEMVVFDLVAYNVDEDTGKFEKEMDIPEYVLIDEDECYMDWNDEYYYVIAYTFDEYDFTYNAVYVYDHSFNYVSSWTAPSYVTVNSLNILNNGDILVQYSNKLDEDAKDFDYYDIEGTETVKYDLVTLVVRAKNGNVKDVDLKYMVEYVMTNNAVYDEEDDNNYYNDSFDNIAYVYPIVNQRIDNSDAAEDIVLMSDKGKIKKSLKLVDGQVAMLPDKLADDVYYVEMLHGGFALVNIDGDVLKMINSGAEMELMGQYLVSERFIYDFNLEVVYDLKANDAKVLSAFDEVLLVQAGTEEDGEYTVYSICDGEKKAIYTYSEDAEENDDFYTTMIGYVIIDAEGTHTYYNEHGKELLSTNAWLQFLNHSDDVYMYSMIPDEGEDWDATYYVFTK